VNGCRQWQTGPTRFLLVEDLKLRVDVREYALAGRD